MSSYRIFDLCLKSMLPLAELPQQGGEADLTFELVTERATTLPRPNWTHQWRLPNGQVTLAHAREADNHRLSFPRLADFQISADGRKIRCLRCPGVAESSIRHLLLDQVLPRIVSHFRHSVLHASAVRLPTGVVAFLGNTGWGKSTLGLSFEKGGHTLLGDDALLVDSRGRPPTVVASYPGCRLWDDSLGALGEAQEALEVSHYSTKRRVVPSQDDMSRWPQPEHLQAVFLLNDPTKGEGQREVEVEGVRGVRAVMALVEHCFHLDVKDRRRMASQFDELSSLVSSSCRFYHLRYPRDHQRLHEVHAAIVEAARTPPT
ncbi:MAG: hypothetical protein JRH20_09480 [Deltaproteobacteria bacterium]|nr:hypothetical protein [Deltaproteobacteria bacterium]